MRDVLCGRMPGVHLNAEGEREAAQLARCLKSKVQLSSVVSSPFERAVETAEIIGREQEVAVSIDEDFGEVAFGDWTGKYFAELQGDPAWQWYNEHRSLSRAPLGESLTAVQARASRGLADVSKRYEGGTVAVVTHGDVIRALLVLLLGMSLDHISRLEIAPASVSELSFGPGGPVVMGVNQRFSD